MDRNWFVYIITNYTNSVIYTGVTNNLKRRIWQYKNGLIESAFSKKYRLYKLIWYEEFSTPSQAIDGEKKIKGWRRKRKLRLIKSKNPNFQDLFTLR